MKRILWLAVAVISTAVPARAVEQKAIDHAIERGVQALRRLQKADGRWPHEKGGATSLAGLTLLVCGADANDRAVRLAAEKVRQAGLDMTDTYSLALSVFFLDKLDIRSDTPLIESMLVRLLAGQTPRGHWAYECPAIDAAEKKRVQQEMAGRQGAGGRDLSLLPARGKRKVSDLPESIQAHLVQIARGQAGQPQQGGDNSNTQFALMALWIGRGYGLPTQPALLRLGLSFRNTQTAEGGWGYNPGAGGPLPAMTCAGLLGLAAGHGAGLDVRRVRDPEAAAIDVGRDPSVRRGLLALSTAVGRPTGWSGMDRPAFPIQTASGKAFYFLWSLERVAVTYNLTILAGKDWYRWGSEVLLVSQRPDGSWQGEFGGCGADTCFALLFLKKANLARDLSSRLSSKGLNTTLKQGGVGGAALRDPDKPAPSREGLPALKPPPAVKPEERSGPAVEKKPGKETPTSASDLASRLSRAAAPERPSLLKQLRDGKGTEYTEALVGVIGRLEGASKRQAREALADRLTRMKLTTLHAYLKDEDVEIRRAAALAVAQQDSKALIPDLIRLLFDPEPLVERAAHAALKAISGQDFGPAAGANPAARMQAAAAWVRWWRRQARP